MQQQQQQWWPLPEHNAEPVYGGGGGAQKRRFACAHNEILQIEHSCEYRYKYFMPKYICMPQESGAKKPSIYIVE